MKFGLVEMTSAAVPLYLVERSELDDFLSRLEPREQAQADAINYRATASEVLLLTDIDGRLSAAVVGLAAPVVSLVERDLWALSMLPTTLPQRTYRLVADYTPDVATLMTLGWALGCYSFEEFKPRARPVATLVWPKGADRDRVLREAEALKLGRDLVNRPASHLGCEALTASAMDLAEHHGAAIKITKGDDLLVQNYPMIYHVGRAAVEAPRLVDITWGNANAPKVTLVGKGVIFDTGGLNLKAPASMELMKKDMAGAASMIAVAHMIMAAKLPVRLRLLLPIVENAIGPTAFRPLDVLSSRKGFTVEIGNTDAEGRLILADALTEADREAPEILINACTLTGSARMALGPDIPSIFTRHDDLADALCKESKMRADPVWRMPLWPHYRKKLDSRIAHINNVSESAVAGAIIAGLFLAEFVSPTTPWLHCDLSGWNFESRPGRPEGGEVLAARAIYGLIETRFCS